MGQKRYDTVSSIMHSGVSVPRDVRARANRRVRRVKRPAGRQSNDGSLNTRDDGDFGRFTIAEIPLGGPHDNNVDNY